VKNPWTTLYCTWKIGMVCSEQSLGIVNYILYQTLPRTNLPHGLVRKPLTHTDSGVQADWTSAYCTW
jgi:hypothetical protein